MSGPTGRPKRSQSSGPAQLEIDLDGDRRLAENVIEEVRAAARSLGLEIADVQVIRETAVGSKARKPASRRKTRRP